MSIVENYNNSFSERKENFLEVCYYFIDSMGVNDKTKSELMKTLRLAHEAYDTVVISEALLICFADNEFLAADISKKVSSVLINRLRDLKKKSFGAACGVL